MTKLSVNINKIATLRNARGGNVPDVVKRLERMVLPCIHVPTNDISLVRMC